jgi:hypothetical protein
MITVNIAMINCALCLFLMANTKAGLWFAATKLDGQEMLFVTAYPNNGWNGAGHPLKKAKESMDAVLADLFHLHIVEFDRCGAAEYFYCYF